MVKPLPLKLDDETAERVRDSHHKAIEEMQSLPGVRTRIVPGVSLVDGVATPVSHKLGRIPLFVTASIPRGAVSAGYIVETSRDAQSVTLTANGYGATIVVDLAVS